MDVENNQYGKNLIHINNSHMHMESLFLRGQKSLELWKKKKWLSIYLENGIEKYGEFFFDALE